ncbi:MAG TPA: hypothetical protein VI389_06650, partial [Geobacteraceae bacterium]
MTRKAGLAWLSTIRARKSMKLSFVAFPQVTTKRSELLADTAQIMVSLDLAIAFWSLTGVG